MKDQIRLDTNSNESVFCNKKYVTNIRDTDRTFRLQTSARIFTSTQLFNIPHLGYTGSIKMASPTSSA